MFTSVTTAYQLACTLLHKNFAGFTIADCTDNTASIFEDKAKQPYTLLPDNLKHNQKYNNKKEMFSTLGFDRQELTNFFDRVRPHEPHLKHKGSSS